MSARLTFAVPSKGRLMEQTAEFLGQSGLTLRKVGHDRGYRGEIEGVDGIDVAFISASEIVAALNSGRAHIGVTGEDLVRENISNADERVTLLKPLGFGRANVVVAVPRCWLDVSEVADLEAVAAVFRREHGRPIRVATKYINLARRFLSGKGLADYRIVESLGATEGTPAAGTADIIVDITTTGATLAANGLKVLEDGVILRSEANLVASKMAGWGAETKKARDDLLARLGIQVEMDCKPGDPTGARGSGVHVSAVSAIGAHEGVDAHAGQQRHLAFEVDGHLQHLDVRRTARSARGDARRGHGRRQIGDGAFEVAARVVDRAHERLLPDLDLGDVAVVDLGLDAHVRHVADDRQRLLGRRRHDLALLGVELQHVAGARRTDARLVELRGGERDVGARRGQRRIRTGWATAGSPWPAPGHS